ncbi:MAG: response regulator [Clostridia bacterium]|nr:response regulator [Clostridia bacterium]
MLRAVLIDDERPALDELTYLLEKKSVEVIGTFMNTEGALDFISCEKPDIVFLDIEIRDVNGIDFGVEMQSRAENTAIIFVTAYPNYSLEAFKAYPLDYIVKPVDEERLARTLRHVHETAELRSETGRRNFYIRCFGKLDIIYGDHKIKFPTKKTRELFVYLICNEGTVIYRGDLLRLFFGSGENEKDANNLRVSMFRIRNALREAGAGKDQFLIKDDFSVGMADGVCDMVDFQRFIRNNPGINAKNITRAEKVAELADAELLTDIDALWVTEKREWVIEKTEELLVNMSIFYLSGGLPGKAEAALLRLLALNSLSDSGYRRLLDLYIRTGNALKYRYAYEQYREMTVKEFGERLPKFYSDFYVKCT